MAGELKGVFAALLTPFDEKGKVSESRLRNLVDFLAERGLDGLYVCGGTGEGILMETGERKVVAEIVRDQVGTRKVTLVAHVGGSANTRCAIELARHAEKLGYDGVSSIPPIYYPYRFQQVYAYYRDVAESTSLPFLVYHVPACSGVTLPVAKMAELAGIRNIAGLKYTHSDFFVLQDLLRILEGRWIAFSGSDELFLPGLTMGTVGSIGSTQNVLPELFVRIHRAFREGKLSEAMKLQERVTVAVSLLLKYGGTAAWKTALKSRGVDAGYARHPQCPRYEKRVEEQFLAQWRAEFPDFADR